jgi:hypothetical protein
VKVYPNPVSSFLYVDGRHGIARPLRLQLFDLTGQIIIDKSSDKESFRLNVENIKPGIYIFKMTDANGEVVSLEKIVIK